LDFDIYFVEWIEERMGLWWFDIVELEGMVIQ
jgi:hypothetical protein